VADSDGLENRCGCKPTVGSNPTPSASQKWFLMPMAVARRWGVAEQLVAPRRTRRAGPPMSGNDKAVQFVTTWAMSSADRRSGRAR
jgi:hypothetical protein